MKRIIFAILFFSWTKVFGQEFNKEEIFFNLPFLKGIDSVIAALNSNSDLVFIKDSTAGRRIFIYYGIKTRKGFYSNDFIPDSVILELIYAETRKKGKWKRHRSCFLVSIGLDYGKINENISKDSFYLVQYKLVNFFDHKYYYRREYPSYNSERNVCEHYWRFSKKRRSRPQIVVRSSVSQFCTSERLFLGIEMICCL